MLRPVVTATRQTLRLDGLWRFALDSPEAPEPWTAALPGHREAPVPASYDDVFVDPEVRAHLGWVWYQRVVEIPAAWEGERIVVRVDAATHAGRVYVDDRLVTQHVGGYTPFEADITEAVRPGERIRLTIGVSGELSETTIPPGHVVTTGAGERRQTYSHDFYNYAGLARSVWLLTTPRRHLESVRVTTGYDGTQGWVDYAVAATDALDIRVELRDEGGRLVATAEGAEGRLEVDDVVLWQPGAAYLYELTVDLDDRASLVDRYRMPVGVRTVEVVGDRFLINGEPFYFTGYGKHEDLPVKGKGHDDAHLVHDFELMGWTGANSFRTAHYPYAEDVLDYADRHGIVVVDETAAVGLNLGMVAGLFGGAHRDSFTQDAFGEQTRAAHARHLRELIERDRHHPSVVMWSIANEPASNEPGARAYFEPLVQLARELDPTRPLTFSIVFLSRPDTDVVVDLVDVVSLNRYFGWYIDLGDLASAERKLEGELTGWTTTFGKPVMLSEYGAESIPGLHSVTDAPWSEEYQYAFLDMHHRVFDRVPGIVGEHVWNFADFQTGAGVHRVDGNRKGVFTRDRQPKAAARLLRERWTRRGPRGTGDLDG